MSDRSAGEVLPLGWSKVTLGEILSDVQPGFASGKYSRNGDGVPHLRPMNISRDGRIDRVDVKTVPAGLADRPTRRLRRGDIVFNNTNSLALVGKTALFDGDDEPAFSNHMTRLRVREECADPNFIARYLQWRWRSGDFRHLANNHVSQASVGRSTVEKLSIDLPPIAEQRRITFHLDRIEESCRLANKHFQNTGERLARLRVAVLSAACAGRLSADWREKEPDSEVVDIEDPALQRRRATDKRFVAPKLNPRAVATELPQTWSLVPLGLLLEDLKYGTSKKSSYEQVGVPVLRIPNVSSGTLDLEDMKFADLEDREISALALQDGDLLMIRSNGSVRLLGVAAEVAQPAEGAAYAGYLMRLRADRQFMHPDFLWLMLAAPQLRRQIEIPARSTSGVHNMNREEVRALGVPVPSLDEQEEIVRKARDALEVVDRLAQSLAGHEARLGSIQGTLQGRGFRGELSLDRP